MNYYMSLQNGSTGGMKKLQASTKKQALETVFEYATKTEYEKAGLYALTTPQATQVLEESPFSVSKDVYTFKLDSLGTEPECKLTTVWNIKGTIVTSMRELSQKLSTGAVDFAEIYEAYESDFGGLHYMEILGDEEIPSRQNVKQKIAILKI